jgi:hypothetical protein
MPFTAMEMRFGKEEMPLSVIEMGFREKEL